MFFAQIVAKQFFNVETNMKNHTIDLFMPISVAACNAGNIDKLVASGCIGRVYFWCSDSSVIADVPEYARVVRVDSLSDTALFMGMARAAFSDFVYCRKSTAYAPIIACHEKSAIYRAE